MSRGMLALAVATGLGLPAHARAHGGETHAAAPAAAAAVPDTAAARRVEARTEALEVLIERQPAHERGMVHAHAFVTDWATNAPVAGARVSLSFPELGLDVPAEPAPDLPGLYELALKPPREGRFAAILSVQSSSVADLVTLDAVPLDTGGPVERGPRFLAWRRRLIVAAAIAGSLGLAALVGWLVSRRHRSRYRDVTATGAALLGCLALASAARAHGGEDHGAAPQRAAGPAGVAVVGKEAQIRLGLRTIVAEPMTLVGRRAWRGVVVAAPDGQATVIAPASGRASSWGDRLPRVGDRVRRGQPLVVVLGFLSPQEQVEARSGLAAAMARRVAAAQELSLARRDLDRIAALPQVASRREAESAEARLRAAEAAGEAAVAEVAILEAAARGAEDSATRHVLEAPVDGVITTADVTHGEAVDAGHVLYTILDPARLSVRADVPEGQAHALLSLAPGAEARVVPAGGRPGGADAGATATAPARFAGASRSIDSATRSVAAYFDVAEGGHALLEGQLVDVLVASAATVRGFLLPASAVVAVDGQPVVFAHAAAEAFVPRPIRLGVTDGDSVEVLEGLDGGERVVVSGASQVRAALLAGGR